MAKRRKNGEGTFTKNGNGFDYRISYKNLEGESKYKYFWAKTKEECHAKATKWRNEQDGTYSDDVSDNLTVEQWANCWFDNYVVGHVKITTISDDRSILDHHIIPGLGHRRLKDLTGHRLTLFYNACMKKDNGRGGKLDPKTVKNIRAVVNRMLDCAFRMDVIKENPNTKTRPPKCSKKEAKVLNNDDYEKLIKYCLTQGTTMDLLIIFFLCIGSRLGETLGLQWSKIDFEKRTLRIDQQLQSVPNDNKNSKRKYKQEIIDSTKTKYSDRTLPMGDEIYKILKHIKHLQAVQKMKLGQGYRRDLDLVFCKDDGYFICDTIFRKFVNKRLADVGIEHHKIHSFRHSCATFLFNNDINIKLVSKWLGHCCVGITYDIYTHVLPHKLDEVVDITDLKYKKIFNNSEKEIPDEILHPKRDV